jgi:hypothetical protein
VRGKTDKIYDLVVIGDEPAGLWCLRRAQDIHDRLTRSRNPKIPRFPKPALAWITYGKSLPVALPTLVAKQFGLRTTQPWHLEIATPKRTFLWNKENIQQKFPEISLPSHALKPTSENLSALRYCLRVHPEILGFASGIWRFFGAAEPISPEGMIWTALLSHSLVWWEAKEKLDFVDTEDCAEGTDPTLTRLADKNWKVEWQGKSLIAKSVLWNPPKLEPGVATSAEFPVSFLVDTDELPAKLPPIILYFDTEEIPEPQTEVWPFEIGVPKTAEDKKTLLRFWIREPMDTPREIIEKRYRAGLERVQQLFPHAKVQNAIVRENERRPRFSLSTFTTEDPIRARVFTLPISYQCQFPYPMGTLKGARKVLREVLGRTRVKWVRKEAAAKGAEL